MIWEEKMGHILGVDIGGTFTDFSLIDDKGNIALWKQATTPKDPAIAVKKGLASLADAQGITIEAFLKDLDLFVHGQTIATNTVIQKNGPKTALLCTEGFRDVLYFRDGFKPDRYNINLPRSKDFIRRDSRLPVKERMDYRGKALVKLDEDSVRAAAKVLKKQKVESVAVALLWSIMNPKHEVRVKKILAEDPTILTNSRT